jgi:hypothetical protein
MSDHAEIAVISANPLDMPATTFKSGLDRRKENRAALMLWVKQSLIEGIDYGQIQTKRGLSKPSLWKPGAEKICGMLGVIVSFPTLNEYENAVLNGKELKQIIIRCEIKDAQNRTIADGVGARTLEQDYGDINKALKMAEKSAHIDATLRMAGLSEVFTQDLEDMLNQPDIPQQHPIEQEIHRLGLDKNRVMQWINKASHGMANTFNDLTPNQCQKLMALMPQWAQQP